MLKWAGIGLGVTTLAVIISGVGIKTMRPFSSGCECQESECSVEGKQCDTCTCKR